MFLVIQRAFQSNSKNVYQRGEVVSRHKTYFNAMDNLNSKRLVVFKEETDQDYKVGEIALDLLEREELKMDINNRIALAVDVLRCTQAGEAVPDGLKFRIADYQKTLAEFMECYQDEAQAILDEEVRQRQELAERAARVHAIGEEVQQLQTEFCYSFPAVRGIQAGKQFFTTQIPYGTLIKLFRFDDETVPAELRAQRELNVKRAEAVGEYVLNNPRDYVLPALTASVSAAMNFKPLAESGVGALVGTLYVPMDAILLINDGQHRRGGIEIALKDRPSLATETVAITIYYDQGLKHSQQIFSDINGRQVKPSSAINALFDHRNGFNVWTKELLEAMPDFSRRVEKEASTVGAKSMKYWSLISFQKFVSALTGINEKNADLVFNDKAMKEAATVFVVRFLNDECRKLIPLWSVMLDGSVAPSEVRCEHVIGHAVFFESLGVACRDLLPNHEGKSDFSGFEWERLNGLSQIVSHKDSDMWAGRCVRLGVMQKNAQGIQLTANRLRMMMQIELSDDQQALELKLKSELEPTA